MSRSVKQLACRFHPEAILIEDYRAGDMICPECGLVVGDRMVDVSSEWRTFSNDTDSKDMSRVGAAENPLFNGDTLGTVMSLGTGAGALNELGQQKYSNGPLQMSSTDKALRSAYDAIRQMAGHIALSKRIINRAFSLFKECYEKKSVRGRSQDIIVAACIYIACRQEGGQRTIKEICAISTSASKKDIGRCFKQILKSLPNANRPESIDVKNLVPRFCSGLELHQENLIKKAAVYIAERAKDICDIQSRAPDSIAGASIYMACAAAGEHKLMEHIQLATGAMENTIRQVYKIMRPNASELFPADFIFKCLPANLPSS
jgi:transcription initiation factor TFIIB